MPRRPTTARQPKYEVISLRLTGDRMELVKRYRAALASSRGHNVSVAEALFSALKGEARELERAVAHHELAQAPTAALHALRRAWHADRSLSAAQWILLADYIHAGTDADQQPPHPGSPAPTTCRTLLDAFEAVYRQRRATTSDHRWLYAEGVGPDIADAANGDAPEGNGLLARLARHRHDPPLAPAALARHASLCFRTAVRHEDVPPALLDRALAPHWPTLWRLAARGHWLRHHRPLRLAVPTPAPLPWPDLPAPTQRDDVTLSFTSTEDFVTTLPFTSAEGPDFVTTVRLGQAPHRVGLHLREYLKLVEFRALLAAPHDLVWHGRFFATRPAAAPATRTLLVPNALGCHFDLFSSEWDALRQLLDDAWRDPFLQARLETLADDYGAPV